MTSFDVLISQEEAAQLLENSIITINDRFRIDSLTYRTLLSELGSGFSQSELQEVYHLESSNLKKIINVAMIYFTDENNFKKIAEMQYMRNLLGELKLNYNQFSAIQKEAVYFSCFIKFVLSDFKDGKVKFDGTIPKKLFSMRQMTAEMWYENYVDFVLRIALKLYQHGRDLAFGFLFSNMAYYLNKSQQFRYYRKPYETMNESISRILIEFANINYTNAKQTINNAQMFKDLKL